MQSSGGENKAKRSTEQRYIDNCGEIKAEQTHIRKMLLTYLEGGGQT